MPAFSCSQGDTGSCSPVTVRDYTKDPPLQMHSPCNGGAAGLLCGPDLQMPQEGRSTL